MGLGNVSSGIVRGSAALNYGGDRPHGRFMDVFDCDGIGIHQCCGLSDNSFGVITLQRGAINRQIVCD